MADPEALYREPAARPLLLDAERRWFTKHGDVERGPYDADALMRSVKRGFLSPNSIVRAEDETVWRPLSRVAYLSRSLPAAPSGSVDFPSQLNAEPPGRLALGFCAGFFGGCIGALAIQVMATGKATNQGAWAGFFAQIAFSLFVKFVLLAHR